MEWGCGDSLIPGLALVPTVTGGTESGLPLTFTDGMESGLALIVTDGVESGPGISPRSGDTQLMVFEDPSSSEPEFITISIVDVGSSCFMFRGVGEFSALLFP